MSKKFYICSIESLMCYSLILVPALTDQVRLPPQASILQAGASTTVTYPAQRGRTAAATSSQVSRNSVRYADQLSSLNNKRLQQQRSSKRYLPYLVTKVIGEKRGNYKTAITCHTDNTNITIWVHLSVNFPMFFLG